MKIGIMSMQRIINYGSFLQAYGLKQIIESLNHEVEFIDYKFENSINNKKTKKNYFNKIIKNKNLIKYLKKKKQLSLLKEKFENEYLPEIGIKKYNYNKDVDCLVIGSDEVFNCMQPFPVGYSRNLFGAGYENHEVISYAASFGYTKFEDLKENSIDKEIAKMLNNFKSISVRDKNSFDIVQKLTKIDPYIHLDPVLVSDYSNKIKEIDLKNYIVIYAYPGRLTNKENKYIKKFARKNKKKIISLGFYQEVADYNFVVHPFDVLSFIKSADYVITDTFHGTVFSIKMNTKFCTLIRDSNRNKLGYLLKKLKQENRMVSSLEQIDVLYKQDINFSETNEIIKNETKKTIEYLKNNI